jgi:lipopolysaccharide assembly outer membrane protein LptD (OstA)
MNRSKNSIVRRAHFFVIFFVVCFAFSPRWSYAQDPVVNAAAAPLETPKTELKADGPVELKGDRVEFNNTENKFDAQGNVIVTRGETKIYADSIQFYRQENIGMAEGNIVVETPTATISGDKMTYSLDKQTGNFTNAHIASEPYFGKGTIVSKVGPNKMNMQEGYITTCDHDEPHFRLQSSSIDIEPGKQAQARRVKMFVGPLPVMYLPRYTQSLADRRPRYSLTPGYSKDFGFFVLQSWRYDYNEKVKGVFHADFRDRKGAGVGADLDYKTDNYGEGMLRTYYMNEYDIGASHIWEDRATKAVYTERYRGLWRHRWDVDEKTNAVWQYSRLSDPNFLKDYFKRESRIDPDPKTYFSMTRVLPLGTLGMNVQARVNRYNTEVEHLPEVSYNLTNAQIGQSGFFYKNASLYSNLVKKFAIPTEVNLHTQRFDTQNEISYPTKVGFVEFRPFVGTQHTYYSRAVSTEDYDSIRGQFKTGADLSTKFSKVYDVNGKPFGIEINRLRHIITPSIGYFYAHDPTVPSIKFDQYDAIDTLERSHRINLALENKLQTKRDGKAVDLARLVLETPFLLKEDPGKGGFGSVITKLELRPSDWLSFSGDTTYNTHEDHLQSANYDMYITNEERGWYFNLGERYNRDVDNQITAEWGYTINPLWKFKIYDRFDINDGGQQKEQQFTLTRDLHEWEMDTSFNHTRGEGSSIMLIFRLKAFPGLAIDASTGFNRRRAGSSGE